MKIAVVIPAYNSEATIGSVISRVNKNIDDVIIIVVNDGSNDKTSAVSQAAKALVLSHPTNRGKGAALKTGFKKALELGVPLIATLDADEQHPPEMLPLFFKALHSNSADVIIGNRMKNLKKMPFQRILTNKITSGLISLRIGKKIEDSQCGFRLIRAELLRDILLNKNRFDLESELILKAGIAGYHFSSVPIATIYQEESSAIHGLRDTLLFIKLYLQSLWWY